VPVLEIPATGNAQDATNPYERAGTTPDEHAGTSR